MSVHESRLTDLRAVLKRQRLDGFVVPLTDEHLSEYVGAYARRLAWLTGFTGSAGTGIVLPTQAAIFVDGRYTLQVREEVDAQLWSYQSTPETIPATWLGENAPVGARVGFDPWLHSRNWVHSARAALAGRDAELVAVESNPIDEIWRDRPAPSAAKVTAHPLDFAGRSSQSKRAEIARWLTEQNAATVVFTTLDSIAWTFNLRGRDIEHTPVTLAYALVHADARAELFIEPVKVDNSIRQHLSPEVDVQSCQTFPQRLQELRGGRVIVDADRSVEAIWDLLERSGANVRNARDPVLLPKAIKNDTEIAGHKAAQKRDGAALTAFLHWLSVHAPQGTLTEWSAAQKLREFREATGCLLDLSFATISAAGPHTALPHYSPTETFCRAIRPNELYLVDSGGQYADGTTDVTRTIAVGTPTDEMRDRFTRVLKGHIALATATFPAGTRGCQLDTLARQYLWQAGLDYSHGTGHGVGAYLGVHEGPQRIAAFGTFKGDDEPLVPGMLLSNEPGYYKPGHYGIRIENLLLVVPRQIESAERETLGFETVTLAPLDRSLIKVSLLSPDERNWVDAYHAEVAAVIGPQLEDAARAWLREATRPLT